MHHPVFPAGVILVTGWKMRTGSAENDAPVTITHLNVASCIGRRHSSIFHPLSNVTLKSVMHFPYPGTNVLRFRDFKT